jgi:serpin B
MTEMKAWLNTLFGKQETSTNELPPSPSDLSGPDTFGQDNNRLALALFASLRAQPGNLFFSPFSIRTVLSMAYAGARDETARQTRQALHFSEFDELLHLEFGQVIQRLNAAGGGLYEMAVANALFEQDGSSLQERFIELITEQYRGVIRLVDFRAAAESVRAEINSWVADKTRQRITGLIPPGGLNAESRLVLVNAVYFKGRWTLPFNKASTREELFYLEGEEAVPAQLMHQQQTVRYVQGRGFQAVDLDYQGDDLSLLVLLPDKKDGLKDLERNFSVHTLTDCVNEMWQCEVKLHLPRFKINWGVVDLTEQLIALGMKDAFDRTRANFSGINGLEPPHQDALFISSVFHKAFVEVNEEGTEAAAATAVTMQRIMGPMDYQPPPVPIFRADHPFLFAIRDRRSKAILFLGRVADPR